MRNAPDGVPYGDGQEDDAEYYGWIPSTAPLPTVAAQQTVANPADAFRNMFAILHNLGRMDLEEAGLIASLDDDKWKRFNTNLTTFVLKLDDARLDALYALVQERQPARYKQ